MTAKHGAKTAAYHQLFAPSTIMQDFQNVGCLCLILVQLLAAVSVSHKAVQGTAEIVCQLVRPAHALTDELCPSSAA